MSDNNRNYSQNDAINYIQKLGCWTFVNPTDAVKRRNQGEYVYLLLKLIEVNRTRKDDIGKWETLEAINTLLRLKESAKLAEQMALKP